VVAGNIILAAVPVVSGIKVGKDIYIEAVPGTGVGIIISHMITEVEAENVIVMLQE
jgi:hypothetical protein